MGKFEQVIGLICRFGPIGFAWLNFSLIHAKKNESLNKLLFLLFGLLGILYIANPYLWLMMPDFRVVDISFETWTIVRACLYVLCFIFSACGVVSDLKWLANIYYGLLGVVLVDMFFSMFGGQYFGP